LAFGPIYLAPGGELLQGDIYRAVPSIHLSSRPVFVTRLYKEKKGRVLHGVHSEDGPEPQGGYRWAPDQGESVIAKGFMGMAIVLTHDCEIENDPDHRLVAEIRPITEIQEAHRADIMAMHHWAAFPLLPRQKPQRWKNRSWTSGGSQASALRPSGPKTGMPG